MEKKQRDLSIDYLRFIGLAMVILAHVSIPFTLSQLRCFDVPLMVFISGLTASGRITNKYIVYICDRSKRLLIPVYLFLTIYFVFLYILSLFNISPVSLTVKKVIHSYLLLEGIGYVWIIRVFLMIMLLTPLLVRFEQLCKREFLYGVVCLVFLLLNDIILDSFAFPIFELKIMNIFFTDYIMYFVGYIPSFMLGLRMRYASYKIKSVYTIGCIACLVIAGWCYTHTYGCPVRLSPEYKFPPKFYFLIYGTTISMLLWISKRYVGIVIDFLKLKSIAIHVGQNSIWIYLWHIPFIPVLYSFVDSWLIRYVLVFVSALLMFEVQKQLAQRYCSRNIRKYLIG